MQFEMLQCVVWCIFVASINQ